MSSAANNPIAKAFINAIKEAAKTATPMNSAAFGKAITKAVSQPKNKVKL